MFGERRNLILPILFDIANLVRTAADSVVGEPRTLREPMPSAEFLRSFIPLLQLDDDDDVDDDKGRPDVDIEPTVIDANMQDGRLQIDEDVVKTVVRNESIAIKPTVGRKTARSLADRPSNVMEARSYHERKMNMTNFNGTHDQYAMESEGVPMQVTLPRSEYANNPNLTIEEYEQLAFADLNDTISYVRNETTGEFLPAPEMLISRLKAKNPYRKLLTGSNAIDEHGLLPCERFGTICLHVEDYPT